MSQDGIVVESDRCAICKKPDLRRMVELAFTVGKMDATSIASVLGGIPAKSTIQRHCTDHMPEGRDTLVEPKRPLRERALAIQELQVAEIERRIERAQEWAAYAREHGNEEADWSDAFDILGKDFQSAIGSILKAVGLQDKKEAAKGAAAVDLFKLMLGDGGPPKKLIGRGDVIEGEATEV